MTARTFCCGILHCTEDCSVAENDQQQLTKKKQGFGTRIELVLHRICKSLTAWTVQPKGVNRKLNLACRNNHWNERKLFSHFYHSKIHHRHFSQLPCIVRRKTVIIITVYTLSSTRFSQIVTPKHYCAHSYRAKISNSYTFS